MRLTVLGKCRAKYPYLNGNIDYVVKDRGRYFRPALTWTVISSSFFGIRCSDAGYLFDVVGSSIFPPLEWHQCLTGFLASNVASAMLSALNPTVHFQVGNIITLPIMVNELSSLKTAIDSVVCQAVELARSDWDSFETSWDFQTLPVLQNKATTLKESQKAPTPSALTDSAV